MTPLRIASLVVASAVTLAASSQRLHAQGGRGVDSAAVARVRQRYLKQEVRIRARDGTQLFTAIYTPRDTSRRYPIMMSRTPYSVAPYGSDQYPARLGPSARFS